MGPGLKVAWPKRRSEPMKEYDSFVIYKASELQRKMNDEWEGWKVIGITNEFESSIGGVVRWRVWLEKELE